MKRDYCKECEDYEECEIHDYWDSKCPKIFDKAKVLPVE